MEIIALYLVYYYIFVGIYLVVYRENWDILGQLSFGVTCPLVNF